ncbi:MAG: transglutaminase family protein [Arcobacteraceae bacterium]|nr:transglutaminase family protein [Arcobacteraceae bacterium]MDY0328090.1 transglutaminase family protein [Arcobacteraceae bacterium]
MIVNLAYSFNLTFDKSIQNHYFTLRVTPRATPYYKMYDFETNDYLFHTIDGFGNIISFGDLKGSHTSFGIITKAKFQFTNSYYDTDNILFRHLYLSESEFVRFSPLFKDFVKDIENINDLKSFVFSLVNMIFDGFVFERGITSVDSTINTLLEYKKGVCQDFAHLLIAVLRYYRIPARYVSGFVTGEGESHAWVEYFDGQVWLGADPTHNILITNEPYIKIAHGRDAHDTSMNKGVFSGLANQKLSVSTIMEQ